MNKYIKSFALTMLVVCSIGSMRAATIRDGALNADQDNYDIQFYFLNLNISDSSTYLSGSTQIFIKSLVSQLQNIVFDFSVKLVTDSVTVNDHKVQFSHALDELTVTLANPADSGATMNIAVYYHGLGKYSGVTEGIYNKYNVTWDKHITWTLSEPFGALNWFPCKQSLTDKADSVYVFLSTDKTLKAGSNGLLTASVPLPGDRIRYEWKCRYPIDFYLISFTVSNYMDYSFYAHMKNYNDSILVQNYIYNDSMFFAQNKMNIDRTAEMISLFSDLFGPYPFRNEKYGHCVAPFGGGMEHQTMTTLVNFSFLLVSHELAHQWFGDAVTCGTWQDIWVNEGFASYAEYIASQYLNSQNDADVWMSGCTSIVKSMTGGSVYVPDNSVNDENRIFDYRLTYKKGASIIHMIRHEIGNDSIFFDALKGYISTYKNGTATGTEFKTYLEAKTGIDFDQFFNQWYFGQGYPIHSIRWEQRNDTLYITSLQTVSSETPFFNLLLDFKVNVGGRDTLISFRQTNSFNRWQIHLPGVVNSIQADPNHWLLIDLSDVAHVQDPKIDSGFRILPNPARDKIRIQIQEPSSSYTLYLANAEGRIVNIISAFSTNDSLDIKDYPPGLYFLILKEPKTIHIGKFIIQ